MNLLITREYSYDFVVKVMQSFIKRITLELVLQDFTKIDIAMNELFQFNEIITSKEVIEYALDNMVIRKRSQHWSIEFNPVINYPKTKTKLITLLKFISYGNSYTQGNSLLVDEFEKLNKYIRILYKIYKLKGIVT